MRHPEFTFRSVTWHPEHRPEDFSFSRCWVIHGQQRVPGVIYYPHPETKESYLLDDSTFEIVAEYIESIHAGDQIGVEVNGDEITIT